MVEKEKVTTRYEIVEVATETGLVIRDNQKEVTHTQLTALLEILNTLEEIKKGVLGK